MKYRTLVTGIAIGLAPFADALNDTPVAAPLVREANYEPPPLSTAAALPYINVASSTFSARQ